MKKPANTQPQTEYERFRDMLSVYEKVLHPDVWNPIMFQLSKVHEEALTKAYKDAKISDEALAIEGIIQDMYYSAKVNTDGLPSSFNKKVAFKRILQLFNKKQ